MEIARVFMCCWITLIGCGYGLAVDSDISEKDYLAHEAKLHDFLMKNYSKSARPVAHHRDAVTVSFGISLLYIESLDRQTQVLTSHAWAKMMWTDPGLSWNSSQHDEISSTSLPAHMIWQPDLQLYNGVEEGMLKMVDNILPVVSNEGLVLMIVPVTLKSRCTLDFSNFPFDTQTCLLKFGSWVYHDAQINPQLYSGQAFALDLNDYTESNEYELTDHKAEKNVKKYSCCNETYPDLTFTLTLRRRSSVGMQVFMSPSVILSLIVPAVFILPPESKEKMILGIGCLISHVLLFGQLEGLIPQAHPTFPKIIIFFATNIILVCLSIVISALAINAWGRKDRKTPVPAIMRTIFLGLIGRLVCTTRDEFIPYEDLARPTMTQLELESNETEFVEAAQDKVQMMSSYQRLVTTAEWRQLSCVLDRLFFIIFMIVAIVVAICIGHG